MFVNEQNIFILDFVTSQEVSTTRTTTSTPMEESLSSILPRSYEDVVRFDRLATAEDQKQDQSFMNYLKRLMGMISNLNNKRRFQKHVIEQVNNEIDNV